jgi:hypothetical protein
MTEIKPQAELRALALAELKAIYGPDYDVKIVKRRGRGRPKKLVPIFLPYGSVVLMLDEMMEIYRQRGLTERETRKCAFAEAKANLEKEDPNGHLLPEGVKPRSLDMATLERYYRWGIRELRPGEMSLAQEFDEIAARHGRTGLMPEYGAGDYGYTTGIFWRRYRRGKRALSAARRKQEK